MNIEEIKVGETYNVRMRVISIDRGIITAETVLEQDGEWGIQCGEEYEICVDEADAFSPLPSEQPKHDPTRLFKKGDEVRVVAWNGRDIARIGQIGRVVSNEHNSRVELAIDGWTSSVYYPACHLELVTPVEELYMVHSIVGDNGKTAFFAVRKGDVTVAAFFCDTPRAFIEEQARAAAEAERDRLNAEYRKERENG